RIQDISVDSRREVSVRKKRRPDQARTPQAMALRSSVTNSWVSHGARKVGGVLSVGSVLARAARIAGLWLCPSAKYVTPPSPRAMMEPRTRGLARARTDVSNA